MAKGIATAVVAVAVVAVLGGAFFVVSNGNLFSLVGNANYMPLVGDTMYAPNGLSMEFICPAYYEKCDVTGKCTCPITNMAGGTSCYCSVKSPYTQSSGNCYGQFSTDNWIDFWDDTNTINRGENFRFNMDCGHGCTCPQAKIEWIGYRDVNSNYLKVQIEKGSNSGTYTSCPFWVDYCMAECYSQANPSEYYGSWQGKNFIKFEQGQQIPGCPANYYFELNGYKQSSQFTNERTDNFNKVAVATQIVNDFTTTYHCSLGRSSTCIKSDAYKTSGCSSCFYLDCSKYDWVEIWHEENGVKYVFDAKYCWENLDYSFTEEASKRTWIIGYKLQSSSVCGDSICDNGETYSSCPADCPNCDDNNPCTTDSYDYSAKKCVHDDTSSCSIGQTQTQACGKCGTQTRSCTNCQWGAWSVCTGEGECVAGTKVSCDINGIPGEKTCDAECHLGQCVSTGVCIPGSTRICGNCGTQTCGSTGQWGICTGQGECSPGTTTSCVNAQGCQKTKTCQSNCKWQQCPSSECVPGTTTSCNIGGIPGEKVCSGSCSYGSCTATGECVPGSTADCGDCGTKTCDSSGQWGMCNPFYNRCASGYECKYAPTI